MEYALAWFMAAVAIAYAASIGIGPWLRRGGVRNVAGTVVCVTVVACCPLMIPAESRVARAFCCLACIEPIFRVVDYARRVRRQSICKRGFRDYLAFLIPFPFLLTVYGQKQQAKRPAPPKAPEFVGMLAGLLLLTGSVALCILGENVRVLRDFFWVDHLVKLMLFVVCVQAGSSVVSGVERLAGYDAPAIINRPWLARTPAELWFRFNQRVRYWLFCNVFVPAGGRRSYTVGTIAVLTVSGLFHEFFFDLATSRVDGYQFWFFVLQIPAILVSPALIRLTQFGLAGDLAARGITFVWFAATSPLFFRGVDRIFEFLYASDPWLP